MTCPCHSGETGKPGKESQAFSNKPHTQSLFSYHSFTVVMKRNSAWFANKQDVFNMVLDKGPPKSQLPQSICKFYHPPPVISNKTFL